MKGNVIHHAINHINHNIHQVCVRQNTKLEWQYTTNNQAMASKNFHRLIHKTMRQQQDLEIDF